MNRRGFFGSISAAFVALRNADGAAFKRALFNRPEPAISNLMSQYYSKKSLALLQNKFRFSAAVRGGGLPLPTGQTIQWFKYTRLSKPPVVNATITKTPFGPTNVI